MNKIFCALLCMSVALHGAVHTPTEITISNDDFVKMAEIVGYTSINAEWTTEDCSQIVARSILALSCVSHISSVPSFNNAECSKLLAQEAKGALACRCLLESLWGKKYDHLDSWLLAQTWHKNSPGSAVPGMKLAQLLKKYAPTPSQQPVQEDTGLLALLKNAFL